SSPLCCFCKPHNDFLSGFTETPPLSPSTCFYLSASEDLTCFYLSASEDLTCFYLSASEDLTCFYLSASEDLTCFYLSASEDLTCFYLSASEDLTCFYLSASEDLTQRTGPVNAPNLTRTAAVRFRSSSSSMCTEQLEVTRADVTVTQANRS
ncbi:hypothetical protein GBF38_008541, partial [Nibea albiflora]